MSVENPAARRCPPPPCARAMRETSTRSSVARRDTLRRGAAVVGEQVADESRHRRALDRAQVVDHALGVALVGARGRVVLAREVRDGQQPVVEALDAGQPAGQQLELGLRDALVEAPVDRLDVDPGGDQLRGHHVRAGAGVLVHEPAVSVTTPT